MLQETWLMSSELDYLHTIHEDFYGRGLSAMKIEEGLICGRPHGGVGIMWRKNIGFQCCITEYNDPRIIGIELTKQDTAILLVNVYLPYDKKDNMEQYIYYLSLINSIVTDYKSPLVYIIGDYNADLSQHQGPVVHRFGKELLRFCDDECLVIADKKLLNSNNCYTFYSEAWQSEHWLDHVITTESGLAFISNMYVDHKYISSDHFPITMSLDLQHVPKVKISSERSGVSKINWSDINDHSLQDYTMLTAKCLSNVTLDHDQLMCKDITCKDKRHMQAIDMMYNDIIRSLRKASSNTFESKRKCTHKVIPGWNEYVKLIHEEAREAYLLWRVTKYKQGPLFEMMKSTRARFKYALRECKSIETRARADALANKLLTKDDTSFWRDIKKINSSGCDIIAETIDNVTGESNIVNLWRDHYHDLLNSNKDIRDKEYVLSNFQRVFKKHECVTFTYFDVKDTIKQLKCGKSPGKDGLQAEHWRYADITITCLLAMVINSMMIHGYIPDAAMDTIIVPIIKDKKGSITDKNNYRPVAITTVFSKILEHLILQKYEHLLKTHDNQFGFKAAHSTDQCIFTLKQIIEFYNCLSSPVFVCFVDASKAFDRLNHWTLFKKLLVLGIPTIVVRIFSYWYNHQQFCIRWGSTVSHPFFTSNGVRQGGIISPILFNIYMDNLSDKLNESCIGCHFNGKLFNHLMYADDTCVFAPSVSGLQKLLDICSIYADDNTLIFNATKTKFVSYLPSKLSKLHIPSVYLSGSCVDRVSSIKYLGVMLSESLSDEEDMLRHRKYVYAKGNMIIKNFSECSTSVKDRLFASYCMNAYGCHLWTNHSKAKLKSLSVAFNNVYRTLHKLQSDTSMSSLYVSKGIDCFSVILRKSAGKFRGRLLNGDNALINTIIHSCYFLLSSSYSTLWADILFV